MGNPTDDQTHRTREVLPHTLGDASKSLTQSLKSRTGPTVTPEKARYYFQQARFLLGAYRRDEANDPEIYTNTIAALLSDYPDDAVAAVTDPRHGLQTRYAWPPNAKEVKDALEDLMRPRREEEDAALRRARQARLRVEWEAEKKDRASRPTIAEIEKKLGRKIAPARVGPASMPPPPPAGVVVAPASDALLNSPLVRRALEETKCSE